MSPSKTRSVSVKKCGKEQLKVQIDPEVHRLLRDLCARHRRTPAGQIEFMTIMFHRRDADEGPANGSSAS